MLPQLPIELLLQIAGYFQYTRPIGKNDGFSTREDATSKEITTAAATCSKYHQNLRPLVNLALTCKRLTPVAQEVLFRHVCLPHPHLATGHRTKPLISFLRTLVQRPDLARLVERLAVWLFKDTPIDVPKAVRSCACGKCLSSLRAIVERMHPQRGPALSQWMQDLEHPKEAWICALLIASLPKLKALELYANTMPVRKTQAVRRYPQYEPREKEPTNDDGNVVEIRRLASALALTQVEDLTLSTGLNGLHVAKLPSLKTLIVDFSKTNPFVRVTNGCFVNVTTLKIQCLETDRPGPGYATKANWLLSSLPNLRTVEFTCSEATALCSIPLNVEKINIRLELDSTGPISDHKRRLITGSLIWSLPFIDKVPSGSKLRSIEMYWPKELSPIRFPDAPHDLVTWTGVKVIIWQEGKIIKVYG
jgi:hypothetical protein